MTASELEKLIVAKGSLAVSYNEGGSGMGYYFCATVGGEWPFCHGATLEQAISVLLSEHRRIEKEALQKRITEIDASASL